MYNKAAKLKCLSFYIRLSADFHLDLRWWHLFIRYCNGVSFLESYSYPHIQIQTDASGTWGCGALFKDHWFQLKWLAEWLRMDIMVKELVPIVLSCAIWGPLLPKQSVEFKCDNSSPVVAINKGSTKEPMVMHLLQRLWFFLVSLRSTSQLHMSQVCLILQQTCYLETAQFSSYVPIYLPLPGRCKSQPLFYRSYLPDD